MSVIERVGVVGCGLMGSGIAEVCARAGLAVMVREVDAGALEAGQRRVTTSLDRGSTSTTSGSRTASAGRSASSTGRPTWPTSPVGTSWSRP